MTFETLTFWSSSFGFAQAAGTAGAPTAGAGVAATTGATTGAGAAGGVCAETVPNPRMVIIETQLLIPMTPPQKVISAARISLRRSS
jgi:hypothetical protein